MPPRVTPGMKTKSVDFSDAHEAAKTAQLLHTLPTAGAEYADARKQAGDLLARYFAAVAAQLPELPTPEPADPDAGMGGGNADGG
jgi:hypothetical protein